MFCVCVVVAVVCGACDVRVGVVVGLPERSNSWQDVRRCEKFEHSSRRRSAGCLCKDIHWTCALACRPKNFRIDYKVNK